MATCPHLSCQMATSFIMAVITFKLIILMLVGNLLTTLSATRVATEIVANKVQSTMQSIEDTVTIVQTRFPGWRKALRENLAPPGGVAPPGGRQGVVSTGRLTLEDVLPLDLLALLPDGATSSPRDTLRMKSGHPSQTQQEFKNGGQGFTKENASLQGYPREDALARYEGTTAAASLHPGLTTNSEENGGTPAVQTLREAGPSFLQKISTVLESDHWERTIKILERKWSKEWGTCHKRRECEGMECYKGRSVLVTVWKEKVSCIGPCMNYRTVRCQKASDFYCATSEDECGALCMQGQVAVKCVRKVTPGNVTPGDVTPGKPQRRARGKERRKTDSSGLPHSRSTDGALGRAELKTVSVSPSLTLRSTRPSTKRTTRARGGDSGGHGGHGGKETVTDVGKHYDSNLRPHPVATGIRYVWVVSCIVIPTFLFCVGYAVAMQIRRRRYLRQLSFQNRTSQTYDSAHDPFLPPYVSHEDFLASLQMAPPSYEDAMAAQPVVCVRDRTLSGGSCHGDEPPPGEVIPVAPPPYEEAIGQTESRGQPRGHQGLPSYESVLNMNGNIQQNQSGLA